MATTKLYQQDRYIKEWETVITSAKRAGGSTDILLVTLESTAFFPEGGGQSCDTGYIGKWPVTDVQEHDGNVYHTVSAEVSDEELSHIISGESHVSCAINWDRRFDNMQRHCGEHILSGIFHSMFGGVNRGFHMGQDYMTIDISLEDKPEITSITFDDAINAQLEANRVIWSNAPVTVMRFDSREEAEKLPLRKALAFDEDISIVCVGSVENASDCVACCGTHPDTAGQVGLIKIYKVEKYKNMFRIYFEAGQRALKDYDMKHNILTDLSNRYSSSVEDFPDKLTAQEEKLADAKDELFHLKKAFIENECHKLDQLLEQLSEQKASAENPGRVIVYALPHLSTDDAFAMAKRYINKTPALILLYAVKDTSYVLVSDGSISCGDLVKKYASLCNGKGGGSSSSARAMFKTARDAEMFADKIQSETKGV